MALGHGAYMGKKKLPGKIWIDREMFQSKAFIELKGFAPQLLVLVLGKRQYEKVGRRGKERWILTNGDKINITYTEFSNKKKFGGKKGITQPRLTRAIDQLLEKGFISIILPGGTYRHEKAVYALSDSWLIWQPGMVFETRQRDSLHRGFCQPKKQKSHT